MGEPDAKQIEDVIAEAERITAKAATEIPKLETDDELYDRLYGDLGPSSLASNPTISPNAETMWWRPGQDYTPGITEAPNADDPASRLLRCYTSTVPGIIAFVFVVVMAKSDGVMAWYEWGQALSYALAVSVATYVIQTEA